METTIEKIEWESDPFSSNNKGVATMSKCGKFIRGWETHLQNGEWVKHYFTIDVTKGQKTGGIPYVGR